MDFPPVVITRLVRVIHPKVVPHLLRKGLGLDGPDKPGHDDWKKGQRRGAALALIAALVLPGAAAAAPKPQRIMSLNMCTDLLLLQLVPKSRIASVTYLAPSAGDAIAEGLADGVRTNQGAAEEVLRQKPDLLLTGDMSTPMTRRLAKLSGVRLVEVKSATSFADIREATLQVGAAVGEPARAQALVARMDRTLAELAASAPPRPFTVAAWTGDSVPGTGTLADAIITAAGAKNVGAKVAGNRLNSFGLEELLAARPDVLLYGESGTRRPSILTAQRGHAAVRTLYKGRRLAYPEAVYNCGVPQSADAARDLRAALTSIGRGR